MYFISFKGLNIPVKTKRGLKHPLKTSQMLVARFC